MAGMKLVDYRERLGISQTECARQLGLSGKSKGYISAIESGQPASVRLAFRIQKWSGGAVTAASVCPILREAPEPHGLEAA